VTITSVLDLVKVERENSGHRTIATGQSAGSGLWRSADVKRNFLLALLLLLFLKLRLQLLQL
jgi:hypothetical protein